MKKNIAFFIGDYTRSGGTERSCISVANGLSKNKNLSIFLISTNNSKETPFFEVDSNVTILHLNISNYKKEYFKLFFSFKNILKKNNINAIVAVEVMSLIFILPIYSLSKILGIRTKLIVWEHFNFTVSLGKRARGFCRKMAAKYANFIVVLTKRDVLLWSENLNITGEITSINNLTSFEETNKPYPKNSKNIIAIGRLSYQKGFDRLIDIWDLLLKKHPEHKIWKLQIIGSGKDKIMLENKIKNNNHCDNIEMIANTNNVAQYYENAAFLVMTSRFEGLPMTLIEAQSFRLPIIAFDCLTGPSEVITTKSGFLIENGNEIDFVMKLNELITNKQLRMDMSVAAGSEVNRFSENKIIKLWEELISKI